MGRVRVREMRDASFLWLSSVKRQTSNSKQRSVPDLCTTKIHQRSSDSLAHSFGLLADQVLADPQSMQRIPTRQSERTFCQFLYENRASRLAAAIVVALQSPIGGAAWSWNWNWNNDEPGEFEQLESLTLLDYSNNPVNIRGTVPYTAASCLCCQIAKFVPYLPVAK